MKIIKLLNWFYVFYCGLNGVNGSVVNNIRLVDHIPYMTEVIGRTMQHVEANEWCNLKIPEITQDIIENIFDWHVDGKVTYKNGFLVSVEALDIIQDSVQQVWTYTAATNVTQVAVRGNMRMHDIRLGFDVTFETEEETQHYTATFLHNLVRFDFSVNMNAFTEDFEVTVVVGSLPRTTNRMEFLPANNITQVLAAQFDPEDLQYGINDWATNVFQIIATDVALNQVTFPTICYNCVVS